MGKQRYTFVMKVDMNSCDEKERQAKGQAKGHLFQGLTTSRKRKRSSSIQNPPTESKIARYNKNEVRNITNKPISSNEKLKFLVDHDDSDKKHNVKKSVKTAKLNSKNILTSKEFSQRKIKKGSSGASKASKTLPVNVEERGAWKNLNIIRDLPLGSTHDNDDDDKMAVLFLSHHLIYLLSSSQCLCKSFFGCKKGKISVPPWESTCSWKDDEYLAEIEDISTQTAKNIIKLFSEENTIPFIARYRSDLTGGLKPDKLRKIKSSYDYIQQVHKKANQFLAKIGAQEKLLPEVLNSIKKARTLEELEFIVAPYKKGNKRTLAERAKKLGLETPSLLLLEGKSIVKLENYIDVHTEGLEDAQKVRLGIQHIIADIISKNEETHHFLDKTKCSEKITLHSQFKAKEDEEANRESKYEIYGDFKLSISCIKSYQVLAINRGEAENELLVKVVVPDFLWSPFKSFWEKKWLKGYFENKLRKTLIQDSINDAIKRLLTPLLARHVRATLTKNAEDEAVNVFAANLIQLLLTPPSPGKVVMGIDPGFKRGCKVAVVSVTGQPLAFTKFFLNRQQEATQTLRSLILEYSCSIIALGNGVACRETETFLSELIRKKVFHPLNVSYSIINEQGVSIYSCSPTAANEFPDLDVTIISAISLARRLQNPLNELVKVEPKHLGVGMYQLDVNEKRLTDTLEEIVSECVSFVGVDINTASFHLLKRVAGLGDAKAKEIIKYRSEICAFRTREDLKNVKGIKTKTFLQCSGFIRIVPSTAVCKRHPHDSTEFNPLDQTSIHPESYEVVGRLLKTFCLDINDLGSDQFMKIIKDLNKVVTVEELAQNLDCSITALDVILDVLSKPKDFDLRSAYAAPVFRKKIRSLLDLSAGQVVTGVVRNMVSFGAFVDIGVGFDGLIHVSKMGRNNSLKLNDVVEVKIISIDLSKKKIQLEFLKLITN